MRNRPRLAWLRLGWPIRNEELALALGKFRVAILQPTELAAAEALKAADPNITVLAYKCLSSVRSYEQGPIYSCGISPAQAQRLGTDAGVPEWNGYPGHVQQQVWSPVYQQAWVDSVVTEIAQSPFDGVMADNDVYADYYGHGLDMTLIRDGLDELVARAGTALNEAGKILVPNITGSILERGRWARHAAYGGGLEECWFGWGVEPDQRLFLPGCLRQVMEMNQDSLTIARVPGTNRPDDPFLEFAWAAAWVFFPDRDIAVTATAPDGHDVVPLLIDVDLGPAISPVERAGDIFYRQLAEGEAAVNLGDRASSVQVGGRELRLAPRRGVVVPSSARAFSPSR